MKRSPVCTAIIAVLICAVLFLAAGCHITGSENNSKSSDTAGSVEKSTASADVQFTDYQSGAKFIESVINERGSVKITSEMRKRFNLFARDYRWIYMPDMDGYESFFDTTTYAKSYGYTNFADAVFYVLSYMRYPEKMSDEAMQNAIIKLFAAKGSYKQMPHQAYRKIANHANGYYSPWPESGYDHDRMFYLLTSLNVAKDHDIINITVRLNTYYFNDASYQPGVNENWLAAKSKELGIPELEAAAKLVASGEIDEIAGRYEFETTIRIDTGEQSSRGLNPQFSFSRHREITSDEPF